jgi:hypothetical protein
MQRIVDEPVELVLTWLRQLFEQFDGFSDRKHL